MTQVIKKQDWKGFFDRISSDFMDWEATVELLNDNIGARVLNDGLLFSGITYDDRSGSDRMELRMGIDIDHHQTHNIEHPQTVLFEPSNSGSGGMLDIEDSDGAKTLIEFRRPKPMLVEYVKSEILLAG